MDVKGKIARLSERHIVKAKTGHDGSGQLRAPSTLFPVLCE